MNIIKLVFIILLSTLHSFGSKAQVDDSVKVKRSNAYVFRFLPSTKENIYGICIGPFGLEVMCKPNKLRKSHGLNIQLLGQGLFIPLNRRAFNYRSTMKSDTSSMVQYKDSTKYYKAQHNGILISSFGTMTDISNGIVLSGISSLGFKMNGLAINVFGCKYVEMRGVSIAINNQSYDVKGIQIGLLNRTNKLKGFQFGLWNVNSKRSLPLINWNFRE